MGTQENVVNQNLVGVAATYTYDLKIEQGIYNQHPYFEVSENNMQTNKNPELFCPFLGPMTYKLSREHVIFSSVGVSATFQK